MSLVKGDETVEDFLCMSTYVPVQMANKQLDLILQLLINKLI